MSLKSQFMVGTRMMHPSVLWKGLSHLVANRILLTRNCSHTHRNKSMGNASALKLPENLEKRDIPNIKHPLKGLFLTWTNIHDITDDKCLLSEELSNHHSDLRGGCLQIACSHSCTNTCGACIHVDRSLGEVRELLGRPLRWRCRRIFWTFVNFPSLH